MAAAGQVKAGGAYVEIRANSSHLQKELRRVEAKLRAFGNSAVAIGSKMAGLGVAAAAPFAAAAKTFASFEQQMARVRALTNASDADFQKLNDKAKALGASTVFSASQAAEAMGNFALAGFKVDDIMAAVGPTLDLAAAGQLEIAAAADIAAKIMAGMGIASADLGGTMDILTKAMTTANTDLLMLGDAFKYVGPIAKTAGFGIEEITAAIQLLSNAGIQGEMAGTTLRGMILTLASPSAEAAEMLKALGVSVKDARGDVRPLAAILGDLERGLDGLGSAERLEALGTIFDARQAAGAAELVNQGAARLSEATAALGDSAGTASRIAATQLDTLGGSAKILLSIVEGLAIEVGQAVAPAIREWGERLGEVANVATSLIRNNQEFVVTVLKGVAATVAISAALIGLGIAAKVAAGAFAILGAVIGLLTSPIGLVIAGVTAATAAFFTLTESGRTAFEALKADAMAAFGGIADALKAGDLELAAQILWLSLKVQWQKGVNTLNALWQDWGVAALTVVDDFQTRVAATMLALVGGLEKAWNGFAGFMEQMWARITSIATGGSDAALRAQLDAIRTATANANRGVDARGQEQLDALASGKGIRDEDRFAGARESVAASEAELAALQAELKTAINETRKPGAISAAVPGPGGGSPLADLAEPGALDATIEKSAAKTDVSGSFSASALRGLGAGESLGQDQLDESKEQTGLLKKLNDRARSGKLVFTSP